MKKLLLLLTIMFSLAATASMACPGKGGKGGANCPVGGCDGVKRMLHQLSPEKELLFHKTMRSLHDETMGLRQQIKTLKQEKDDLIIAPSFNADEFSAKTAEILELKTRLMNAKDVAIITLAGAFDEDERAMLPMLMPKKGGYKKPCSGKRKGPGAEGGPRGDIPVPPPHHPSFPAE